MHIPECYDAVKQFEARDRVQSRLVKGSPRCQCCGKPIRTETVLDLHPFGLAGLACQRCVDRHIHDTWIWLN